MNKYGLWRERERERETIACVCSLAFSTTQSDESHVVVLRCVCVLCVGVSFGTLHYVHGFPLLFSLRSMVN